jgi:hypothetical protein
VGVERPPAALVAVFFYQVAYGTNESSYKYGYSNGIGNYETCTGGGSGSEDCSLAMLPMLTCGSHYYNLHVTNLTNSTACVDGFVNGWVG